MTQDTLCGRDKHLFGPGPKRVLALDGGGVRGIISLAYLERIEQLLRKQYGDKTRLCDAFDLIGGTSTGSIIATGLALGRDATTLIEIYKDLSSEGFKGSRWHGGVFVPKFDDKALEKVIRREIQDATLGSEALLTGLAIIAKRLDTGSVWAFHNNPKGPYFGVEGEDRGYTPNKDLSLVKLIRASTAAPTFFAPEKIAIAKDVEGLFVDGGVSPHNNPALMLLMLATLKGYGFRWPTGARNLSILSLGTGTQPITPSQMPGSWQPSAALAVLALRSVIVDNSWLAQTLLQWLGTSPAPWPIDSEIGDCADDEVMGGPMFSYLRYDVMLDVDWLSKTLSIERTAKQLGRLYAFDRPKAAEELLALGREAAEKQVRAEHVAALFDDTN